MEAVAANMYFTVGKIIATSHVQGGQPPVCFAMGVAEYLVYDEVECEPSLSDIFDLSVRHKLQKVRDSIEDTVPWLSNFVTCVANEGWCWPKYFLAPMCFPAECLPDLISWSDQCMWFNTHAWAVHN